MHIQVLRALGADQTRLTRPSFFQLTIPRNAAVTSKRILHSFGVAFLEIVGIVAIVGCSTSTSTSTGQTVPGGDPGRGQQALQRFGCGACHVIPGVTGARGAVGPPLTSFASRTIVAGRLSNTPDNLTRWIQDPQSIEPGNAMPNLDVSQSDARDMAAYLLSLT
jgi:cytochrome c